MVKATYEVSQNNVTGRRSRPAMFGVSPGAVAKLHFVCSPVVPVLVVSNAQTSRVFTPGSRRQHDLDFDDNTLSPKFEGTWPLACKNDHMKTTPATGAMSRMIQVQSRR